MAIKDPVTSELQTQTQGIESPPPPFLIKTPAGWTSTWSMLGVYVGPQAPLSPVVFDQWITGTPGYWAWIQT